MHETKIVKITRSASMMWYRNAPRFIGEPWKLRFFNSQYIKVCSFLFVADPPVIKEAPMSQKVKAGGIAAFICIATGDPLPNITWRKDKKSIPQRYVL